MATIRQRIAELLAESEMSARQLSLVLGLKEKDILAHLPHVARSVGSKKQKLVIRPPVCLACGFEFSDRTRFTRPSRCPKCKGNQLIEPSFTIK